MLSIAHQLAPVAAENAPRLKRKPLPAALNMHAQLRPVIDAKAGAKARQEARAKDRARRQRGELTPRQIALKQAEENRKHVLEAVRHGCNTPQRIREHTGLTYTRAKSAIELLERAGHIVIADDDSIKPKQGVIK